MPPTCATWPSCVPTAREQLVLCASGHLYPPSLSGGLRMQVWVAWALALVPKALGTSRPALGCLSRTTPAQRQILCPWELGSIPGTGGQGSAKLSWAWDGEWALPARSSARGCRPGSRANSGAPH